MRRGIQKTLKRRRGQRSTAGRAGRRDWRWYLLRTDNDIPRVIKNRKDVIAKAMFRDGHLPGEFQRIRARHIFHFGIESGAKSFRESGDIHVDALESSAANSEIGVR